MIARARVPDDIQHGILDRSRRRCALCIHFDNDWKQKDGQLAHLDQNSSNFAEDNLAFLCLPHHDEYDTQRRQTKKLTITEAKTARDRLYAFIENGGDLATVGQQRAGTGGKGGDAKVGGSGIAIGGPGGPAGKYGVGGTGGGGEVHGDGLAAGGAGGAAGDDGVWRSPAKSGYEIAQRALGLPVDPYLRQFGRGGAGGGYQPKLEVIEQLRAVYFNKNSTHPETIFENINAVPLDYLNDELFLRRESWRVRIVDDEYEFFAL